MDIHSRYFTSSLPKTAAREATRVRQKTGASLWLRLLLLQLLTRFGLHQLETLLLQLLDLSAEIAALLVCHKCHDMTRVRTYVSLPCKMKILTAPESERAGTPPTMGGAIPDKERRASVEASLTPSCDVYAAMTLCTLAEDLGHV